LNKVNFPTSVDALIQMIHNLGSEVPKEAARDCSFASDTSFSDLRKAVELPLWRIKTEDGKYYLEVGYQDLYHKIKETIDSVADNKRNEAAIVVQRIVALRISMYQSIGKKYQVNLMPLQNLENLIDAARETSGLDDEIEVQQPPLQDSLEMPVCLGNDTAPTTRAEEDEDDQMEDQPPPLHDSIEIMPERLRLAAALAPTTSSDEDEDDQIDEGEMAVNGAQDQQDGKSKPPQKRARTGDYVATATTAATTLGQVPRATRTISKNNNPLLHKLRAESSREVKIEMLISLVQSLRETKEPLRIVATNLLLPWDANNDNQFFWGTMSVPKRDYIRVDYDDANANPTEEYYDQSEDLCVEVEIRKGAIQLGPADLDPGKSKPKRQRQSSSGTHDPNAAVTQDSKKKKKKTGRRDR